MTASEPGPAADQGASLLLTDYYQLTMFQAYVDNGLTGTASFELFTRKLPSRRNFLVAAGLAEVVEFLETARIGPEEIDWLRSRRQFTEEALSRLRAFRFTGDVDAMPEGTVFFPHEPVLRVTAPLPEAQLVESRIINLLHLQTVVASKAARFVLAAGGRQLVDFGLRRAHGAEAGLLAARASYLGGFAGTATALAAMRYDIPVYGTMAHSFVQAHGDEALAFEHFVRSHPAAAVLLIDTYDTEAAALEVVALARRLAPEGIAIAGVRLDSGDLDPLSRRVRAILDAGGLGKVRILASGGLEEEQVAALVASSAPIDGFGIGTSLTTASDAPALDCAYKLVEYEGLPRRKRSPGKETWPGRKQVLRRCDRDGRTAGDRLVLAGEPGEGRELLVPVMRSGRRVAPLPGLAAAREHAARERAALPERLRALTSARPLDVEIAPSVRRLAVEADRLAGT